MADAATGRPTRMRVRGSDCGVEGQAEESGRLSLADKINQAFATLHPAGRGPYSNREVATWFVQHGEPGEPTISVNYLAMLRSGERNNPTVRHLRALARFFEAVSYTHLTLPTKRIV